MSRIKIAAACVALVALPLAALYWVGADRVMPGSSAAQDASRFAQGSVGNARSVYLAELTRIFVARRAAGISPGMTAGSELAPVHFLNQELEQRGVKWRVRTTDGLESDTYDVS